MAADLEKRDDVRNLVAMLAQSWTSEPCERWRLTESAHDLMQRVCPVTDSLEFELAPQLTRLAARVGTVTNGMADLILQAGEHIIFSEAKLSRIGRECPGSAVILYLLDLGGTDELVRARPAVTLSQETPPDQHSRPDPGAFDRIVTDIQGKDADALDQLLNTPRPPRRIDLTGLRIAP